MIDLKKDINSLSAFKRNTASLVQQMKMTGRPLVLTVNGRAEVVVQDAEAYQRLIDRSQELEEVIALAEGIYDHEQGRVTSLAEAFHSIRQKHGI